MSIARGCLFLQDIMAKKQWFARLQMVGGDILKDAVACMQTQCKQQVKDEC